MFATEQKEGYGTRGSQAVSHPSTGRAQRSFTSVIGREPVHSPCCGRSQEQRERHDRKRSPAARTIEVHGGRQSPCVEDAKVHVSIYNTITSKVRQRDCI